MARTEVEAVIPDAVAQIVKAYLEYSKSMTAINEAGLLKLIDSVTKQLLKSFDEHNA